MGATLGSVCRAGIYYFPFYREATMHSYASNPGSLFLLCYSLWEKGKQTTYGKFNSSPRPDVH